MANECVNGNFKPDWKDGEWKITSKKLYNQRFAGWYEDQKMKKEQMPSQTQFGTEMNKHLSGGLAKCENIRLKKGAPQERTWTFQSATKIKAQLISANAWVIEDDVFMEVDKSPPV